MAQLCIHLPKILCISSITNLALRRAFTFAESKIFHYKISTKFDKHIKYFWKWIMQFIYDFMFITPF